MTDLQKKALLLLIRTADDNGYAHVHPLGPIAEKCGLTVAELYDSNTESGILFEFGPQGAGYIEVCGTRAVPVRETRDMLEGWCL